MEIEAFALFKSPLIMNRALSYYMKTKGCLILAFFLALDCIQRHTITAQLVTAGTYYQEIKTSNRSKMSRSDLPVLTEEEFHCSQKAGCGAIGKTTNKVAFEEILKGTNRSEYGEILEKIKSGFKDCRELYKWGISESGVVDVSWNNGSSFHTFCDMDTDGGGWLVFQRRIDATSFYRNWTDFKNGFGSKEGSFWLGLEALHWMTSNTTENVILRIDLTDNAGNTGYAKYRKFAIGSAAEKYKLSYESYDEGTIGDALARSKGMAFSTPDRDNDISTDNCAAKYRGAWWHQRCFDCNLNNGHPLEAQVSTPEAEGAARMSWVTWKSNWGTIVTSKMMLKVDER